MAKRSNGHTVGKLPGAKEPDYDVGYAKPPVDTRFKPGRSGNPLGRPKGAKNKANRLPALNEERMKAVVIEEAYRMIGVRDGDRLVEIPVIQAVIRSIALNAAKGDQRSQRMFADLLQWVEREDKASHDEWVNAALDYKIEWECELERRKKCGETGPEPIPHPDDIAMNMNTGQIEVKGPMTKEEKVKWDRAREFKAEHDEFLTQIEARVAKRPKDKGLRDMLARHRGINARFAKALGA